ncbi:hypothetical protein LIER_04291 [Lithospermum erythrorhizon]|uniref:Uncharacterized protein n=1 Tax=Lithospermum erythrorhizon TaxID=34254 RepID=A0AAV3NXG4_LITER
MFRIQSLENLAIDKRRKYYLFDLNPPRQLPNLLQHDMIQVVQGVRKYHSKLNTSSAQTSVLALSVHSKIPPLDISPPGHTRENTRRNGYATVKSKVPLQLRLPLRTDLLNSAIAALSLPEPTT